MSWNWKEKIKYKRKMMNWLINFFFSSSSLLWVSLLQAFSLLPSFEIGKCDDIHVKVKIHLIVDTKE